MPHIASTLTCDNRYTDWIHGGDGRLVEGKSVTVKGGFGLANKQFITPQGAILTEVSDADIAFLESHKQFRDHVEHGFIKVISRGSLDGTAAAKGMTQGDKSQPLSPKSFKEGSKDDPGILRASTGQVKAA